MSDSDRVYYLNPADAHSLYAHSTLMRAVKAQKQAKAPASQWAGVIKGLTQKGVKPAEIEMTGILQWLQSRQSEVVLKDEVAAAVGRQYPAIKVVDLANHRYASYTSLSGNYTERLYILSSQAMLIDDAIEDIHFRLESLGFDPSPLLDDPELIDRLERDLKDLRVMRETAWDFSAHHFSSEVVNHGKNLMAHARFIKKDGLLFIQEIQSDWAQQGRRHDWSAAYPKAPFVTNTEQWAGLVLRDLLQTAARDPSIHRVAWTRAEMRNGGVNASRDNLHLFYDQIVKKMVDKAIAKSDSTIVEMPMRDSSGRDHMVMGFNMTRACRESLIGSIPLLSRSAVMPAMFTRRDADEADHIRAQVLHECELMLGSAHMVRFFNRLYDTVGGKFDEIAGRYFEMGTQQFIDISMSAVKPVDVARHESMHFAYEHLLLSHERMVLDMSFFPGGQLHQRVVDKLTEKGLHKAAKECDNPKECAAYGFELWARGEISVHEEPKSVFEAILMSLDAMSNWIRRFIRPDERQTPAEVFTALREGLMAHRLRAEQDAHDAQRSPEIQTQG